MSKKRGREGVMAIKLTWRKPTIDLSGASLGILLLCSSSLAISFPLL